MAAFEYLAMDAKGKDRKGVLQGDTPRQVRQQLRDQRLSPVRVVEVKEEKRNAKIQLRFHGRVSNIELAVFTRQMATLLRAGLPLEEVLHTVSKQSDASTVKNIIMAVRSAVLEGRSLADALGNFPQVFPKYYIATISAGEQSGHLDIPLDRLADYTEERQQLRQKFQLALIYPVIVTSVAILVIVGLLTYVIPQVVQVFEDIGQELPTATRILIACSDFLRAHGVILLIALLMLFLLLRILLRYDAPRRALDILWLHMPFSARLIRGKDSARFARTLGILVESGVPVLEGIRIAGRVMGNLPMRDAISKAERRVREGVSLYVALEECGYFPPIALHLIASGENSGNLEEMLERAAQNQERELQTILSAILGMFEPILILVMGGIVLFIVIAVLLPIFDLNQLVE
uniref:General secretion pathway protein F n=1 Tax=Candidatus Kentrum sp. SD TaxID=2126332 RepID=A0A451BI35_9GAMM|nr:MAG: general secretion pathway protein F [Candidatus Kentron sp. SD]VFK44176.1 MAG: general secretion pathway protein F [Candidatus Kentron sp. SD]VFK77896.1 MAG: general secretion pathway protein F [Candidatus Kentron sp. SD]